MKSGLTKYEGSMVHRALHHRKVPKRKNSKREKTDKSKLPTGMAAGILKVRVEKPEVLCDVITLEGIKQSKTIKQLQAMYDIKGPIKGRTRKKSMRKGRTLRILGDEEQKTTNELSTVGERSPELEQKQKETSKSGGGSRTLKDDIRELERELEEARKIAARGRDGIPGGNPPEGAYNERKPESEGDGGGNAGGVRVGSSSRFPRRWLNRGRFAPA